MKTVRSRDREFRELLTCLERRGRRDSSAVEEPVAGILREVQSRGDAAVAEYTARFDGIALKPRQFPVGRREVRQAYRKVPRDLIDSDDIWIMLLYGRNQSLHRHRGP